MIVLIIFKTIVFTIFSLSFDAEKRNIAFGIMGFLAIYLLSFVLKYANFRDHSNQFISNMKNELNNTYFSCFISDMNNLVVTFGNQGEILNKNKLFDNESSQYNSLNPQILCNNIVCTEREATLIKNENNIRNNSLINNLENKEGKRLIDLLSLEKLTPSSILENHSENNKRFNIFQSLGIFSYSYINTNTNKIEEKYYNISIRNFYFYDRLSCIDLILHNVTEIRENEIKKAEYQIKGNMFSKIAHEFKTPLITITSQLESLDEKVNNLKNIQEDDKYELKEIINISNGIKSLAHYTNFLIQDIIHYTSSDDKQIEIKFENITNIKTDIVYFSQCILSSLIDYFPGNKNKIEKKLYFDEEINHYILHTDKTRLNQVVLNLISNSVKFTKRGFVELSCFLSKNQSFSHENNKRNKMSKKVISKMNYSNLPKYYEELIISINDTGLGIPIKILESFPIGNPTLLSIRDYNNSMGSGLGIGIAKTICSLLNYELSVYSKENEGTLFEIKIPLYLRNNVKHYKVCKVKTKHSTSQDNIAYINESGSIDLNKLSKEDINEDNCMRDNIILEFPTKNLLGEIRLSNLLKSSKHQTTTIVYLLERLFQHLKLLAKL